MLYNKSYVYNNPFILKRLHIVVNQQQYDEERLFIRLSEFKDKQIIINEGLVIHPVVDCREISYTVLKCEPKFGILDNDTLVFLDKCVQSLHRIQLLWSISNDNFDKILKLLFHTNSNSTYNKSDYITKLTNQNTVSGEGPFYIPEVIIDNSITTRTISLNMNFDEPITLYGEIDSPESLINLIFQLKLESYFERNTNKIYFPGQIFYVGDLEFIVYAIHPPDKPGTITSETEIYISLDPWGEYDSVTISPIRDTLPKIYDYNLHKDYLYPALSNKFKEAFRCGDSFNYFGVDFKIIETNPSNTDLGCMRIGPNTNVILGDPIDPMLIDIIPIDDWNRIKLLPPSQQQIALHIALSQLDESAIQRITRTYDAKSKASEAIINRLSADVKRYKSIQIGDDLTTRYGGSVLDDSIMDDDSEIENICTVCFQRFKNLDKFIILKCGHMFHWLCVRFWIMENLACPNCRSLCG